MMNPVHFSANAHQRPSLMRRALVALPLVGAVLAGCADNPDARRVDDPSTKVHVGDRVDFSNDVTCGAVARADGTGVMICESAQGVGQVDFPKALNATNRHDAFEVLKYENGARSTCIDFDWGWQLFTQCKTAQDVSVSYRGERPQNVPMN